MRRIALYEEIGAHNFRPLTWLRPVFELLCGHFSLRERLTRQLPSEGWGAFVQNYLAEAYRETLPHAHVNDFHWLELDETVLVNGRWLGDSAQLSRLTPHEVGVAGETVVSFVLSPTEAKQLARESVAQHAASEFPLPPFTLDSPLLRGRKTVELAGRLLQWPWDLIEQNPMQLAEDFRRRQRLPSKADLGANVAIQGNEADVFIDPLAQIDPFVVFDARRGPIWVEAGAVVQPFTRLEGPCFVGRDTQLFRANIREGCSIGPACRVGGEVEESIFQGYANKYHDGFLGHSYVCPWVNLGALSTNSDLKNDYSAVKVPLNGVLVDSGSTKVGSFFGDHTKTALCSLFNTGSSVGVMSLILPGGELLPKHLPSFTRVWHGQVESFPEGIDSVLPTLRTAMSRRKCELTAVGERLLRTIYEMTTAERALAVQRQKQKLGQ